MKIKETKLRSLIRDMLIETWNMKDHPNNSFERIYQSKENKISLMHDKYNLSKSGGKYIDKSNPENMIKMHLNPDSNRNLVMFGRVRPFHGFPVRLVKLFVEYDARVYYDSNLSDDQKLNLMLDNYDGSRKSVYKKLSASTKRLKNVNCDGQKDKYLVSGEGNGLKIVLCYPVENAKTIVSLNFNNKTDILERLVEFLKSKGLESEDSDENNLSDSVALSKFSSIGIKGFERLQEKCDLPKGELRKNSPSGLDLGDVVVCANVIPKDESYFNTKSHEDHYLVLGFAREEFEDQSSGASYGRASTYRKDPDMFDVAYMSDLKGEIHYLILTEDVEDGISLIGNIFN